MSAKKATLLVMAKMALADGEVSSEEREFLTHSLEAGGEQDVDSLVTTARDAPLSELLAGVENYADRFFIALRAASMAHIDDNLDAREEALYERLVELLEIRPSDRRIIADSVRGLASTEPQPPHARVQELYQQSSFV